MRQEKHTEERHARHEEALRREGEVRRKVRRKGGKARGRRRVKEGGKARRRKGEVRRSVRREGGREVMHEGRKGEARSIRREGGKARGKER